MRKSQSRKLPNVAPNNHLSPATRALLKARRPLPLERLPQYIEGGDVACVEIENPKREAKVYWDARWYEDCFTELGKRSLPSANQAMTPVSLSKKSNCQAVIESSHSSTKLKQHAAKLKGKAKDQLVSNILSKAAEIKELQNQMDPTKGESQVKVSGRSADTNQEQVSMLCTKWRTACQHILRALYDNVQKSARVTTDGKQPTMTELIEFYRVDMEALGYDKDNETFYDEE